MIGPSVVRRRAQAAAFQCLFQPQISQRSIASTTSARASFNSKPSNANNTAATATTATHPRPSSSKPPALSPRWLSDTKRRIGKCLTFGASADQVQRAAAICRVLGQEWRELLAGSEGFLTDEKRAGLLGHKVVWGELDSMVSLSCRMGQHSGVPCAGMHAFALGDETSENENEEIRSANAVVSQNHVNNVTYIRYAESARVNWAYNFAMHIDPEHKREWSDLWTPRGDGMILKSITTDYKFPMTWPDQVSVFHKLRELPEAGASSFVLDVMILSEREQRPSARCVEDIVIYDYRVGKKAPLRPFMLEAFEELYKQQLETRERNTKRVIKILEDVRRLEVETWDRPDAKEDLGGGP